MRSFIASFLALLAGLAAVIGIGAWKIDAVFHTEQPIQNIAGSKGAGKDMRKVIPDLVGHNIDIGDGKVNELVQNAVQSAAGHVTNDSRFISAWDTSLEETRQDWVSRIQTLGEQHPDISSIPDDAAQLKLVFAPVGELSKTIMTERLDKAFERVPGASQLGMSSEGLMQDVPSDLTVETSVPPADMVPAKYLVFAEKYSQYWQVPLIAAGILFLLGLIVAAPGYRSIVWVITGVVIAAAAAVGWFQLDTFVDKSVASAGSGEEGAIVSALMDSVQAWGGPQLIVMLAIGLGIAMIGVILGIISSRRRRIRRF